MFRGQAEYGVDAKGRTIIPQKYREELGGNFIVTKGLDKCLFLFPFEEYSRIEKKISQMPISDPAVRQFVRFFVGSAYDAETDANHRVIIPANLRKYAAINKDAVFVGALTHLEMWANEVYGDAEDGAGNDAFAQKLQEFGL